MAFQFLIGTIKTLPSDVYDYWVIIRFQFLIGTIKTDWEDFESPYEEMKYFNSS